MNPIFNPVDFPLDETNQMDSYSERAARQANTKLDRWITDPGFLAELQKYISLNSDHHIIYCSAEKKKAGS